MSDEQQHAPHDSSTGSLGSFALGAAIAGVIGAGLGILFAPKKGAETREDLRKAATKAARHFKKTRAQVEATLKSVFGKVSDELSEQYLELKGNVLALVHEAKEKGTAAFSREHYNRLVDDAVEAYSKAKKWTKDQAAKMRSEIKEDWKELED